MGDNNWSYSKIYKEIKPYEEYGMYDVAWHDGMSAADGHIGVITSCAPLNDSFIFQNVEYIMPSEEPRYVPLEVGGQLDEARQSVINMDDTWDIHNRKRTNMYCHHPGHQLRVELCRSADITDTNALISEAAKHHHMTRNDDINITDYERYTDFNRSEIVVKYKADGRTITKRTFASLTDDVVITEITGAKDFIVNISVDDFEAMHKFGMDKNKQATSERGMKYSRFVKDDIVGVVAHYPSFEGSELANGGFAGARVKNIVNELGNEQIDIVEWDDNPAQLIVNALSPAKVVSAVADEEEKKAKIIVSEQQLSLAIGKSGQNVRLAAKLTGYGIDIKSEADPEAFADMDKDNAEIVYGEDSEGYDDNQADNVMSLNEDYNEDAASDTEVVEE